MGEVFTLTPMAQAEEGPPQKNTAVLISPQNHSPSLFCVDLSDLTWLFWLLSQECQALSQLSKDSRSGPLSGSTRGWRGGGGTLSTGWKAGLAAVTQSPLPGPEPTLHSLGNCFATSPHPTPPGLVASPHASWSRLRRGATPFSWVEWVALCCLDRAFHWLCQGAFCSPYS